MPNPPNQHRPSRLPYIFLAASAFLAVSALSMLLLRSCQTSKPGPADNPITKETPPTPLSIDSLDLPTDGDSIETTPSILQTNTPNPPSEDIVAQIAKALESGDLATVMRLTGSATSDPLSMERLKTLAQQNAVARQSPIIRQIGEVTDPNTMRWAVELPDRQGMYLDLRKKDGKWVLESYSVPDLQSASMAAATHADPLTVTDLFLQSVLKQDFEQAKMHVLPQSVTDAKIAGLCIVFEEGNYSIPSNRPIRLALRRGDTAGYLVTITNADGSIGAQVGITLREGADKSWRIAEINLDNLLADYAGKFAQGDVHYTPLVRNPAGGETLALYFDFDSGEIDPRASRQLEIVALVLKADPDRKIHISGHTDALGTDAYNQSLSSSRADAVRDFLVRSGVPSAQIVMSALGASQPRRPNVTETGEDNPAGRRVNRRTEIYLDF